MSINRLEDLCLRAIVSVIWCVSAIPGQICKIAYEAAHMESKPGYSQKGMLVYEGKFQSSTYYKLTESILDKIMKMNIKSELCLKIAVYFFCLEQDYCYSMLELTARLEDKSMHNIVYCVAKAVITNNRLDRCATIRKVFFYSFFQVRFHTKNIEKFCSIRKGEFHDVFQQLHSSYRLANRRKTWQKVFEMIIDLDGVYFVWIENASKIYRNALDHTYVPCPKLMLEHVTMKAPLEIVHYFHDMIIGQKDCEEITTRALVSALIHDNNVDGNKENILYLFKNISNHSRLIIFARFHEDIFEMLFNTCFGDFCLEVFRKVCEIRQFAACMSMIHQAIDSLTYMNMISDFSWEINTSFYYTNGKEIFLKMWNMAPNSVKTQLGKKFDQMLNLIVQRQCYELVAPVISDKAFNPEQKLEFDLYVLSEAALTTFCSTDDLLLHCPDLNISHIKENMSPDLLKQLLLKRIDEYDFNGLEKLFKSKSAESQCKRQLVNDKTFMIDMLSIIALTECRDGDMMCFFIWIYDDDEEVATKQFEKCLLEELWFVEIYKRYLLETTNEGNYPCNLSEFNQMNISENKAKEIKTLVLEDTILLCKLCENFTSRKTCDVTKLLKCLFNNDQQIEKKQFLENYILSDQGLARIYQLFEPEYSYYSERLYVSYGFYSTVTLYFHFLQFWVYTDPDLRHALGNALDRIGHPNSLTSYNECEPAVTLLPFESVHQKRVIVDANYRMFRSIINIQRGNFSQAYNKNEDFQDCRRIISLTDFSQRFAMRWAGIKVPVVL